MSDRIAYIDNAKGLLIIMVVIGHVFQTTFVSQYIYNFHMMAFFVIAGMLFTITSAERRKFSKFLGKKILTYAIPFAFFEGLALLEKTLFDSGGLNIKGLLYRTITLDFNNGNLWFLLVLFWAELLLYAICLIIKNDYAKLLFSAALLAVSLVIQSKNIIIIYIGKICRAAFLLIVGYVFEKKGGRNLWVALSKRTHINASETWLACFLLLLISTAFFSAIGFADVTLNNCWVWLLNIIMGMFAVISASTLKWGKWLAYLGENSMVVFGTHGVLMMALGSLMNIKTYKEIELWKGIVVIAIIIALEFPIAYVLNRWFPFFLGKPYAKNRKTKGVQL